MVHVSGQLALWPAACILNSIEYRYVSKAMFLYLLE